MPYGIRKQGDRHCVYNTETGETVPSGCYADRDKALDRQRAMMVHVDDAGEASYNAPQPLDEATKSELQEWREREEFERSYDDR